MSDRGHGEGESIRRRCGGERRSRSRCARSARRRGSGEAAFEAAVPELARLLRGYLTWAGVPAARIEDLAQDAMIRVYLRRESRNGRDLASLKAWMRVICRNLAANDRAKKGAPVVPAAESENPVGDWDLREALDRCLECLREPDRSVFRLRYEREFTTREIAELYGWKMRNCEHVQARARKSMERLLRQQGYDLGTRGKPA